MENKIKNLEIYSKIEEKVVLDKETSKKLTGYATIDRPWSKYYSEEALNAEIPEMTAYQYMCSENSDNLETDAINYYGNKLTFREFIDQIDICAKRFYNLGVRKGDIVTVVSIANPELEIAFYALNKIGAVINLIDVRSDSNTIKKYIEEVDSKIVISLDNFLPNIDMIVDSTNVQKVITISPFNSVPTTLRVLANIKDKLKNRENREKIDNIKSKSKYIAWNEFLSSENRYKYDSVECVSYEKNSLAALVHTGGTTGVPKTVKLSNDNFNAMVLQFRAFNTYLKKDTFLNDIVPFVAYGILGAVHMPLCLGLTNIIAPILSPEEFTQFMIKYKPNNVLAVPTYWENYKNNKKVGKMDLSFLKHPGSGGDSMSIESEKEHNEFFKSRNSDAVIELGYGLTEVGSAAVACVGNINKLGSVGIPLAKNIVGIFEEGTENELKYNEVGEIYIYSPTMMIGYLNNIEEENKVIKIHSDGSRWLHTGDLGYMDEDGFIYITGRIKRMIISGGFKIYPSEIEKVISQHEAVEQCCVIAVDDEVYGSVPYAQIKLKEDYLGVEETVEFELYKKCMEKLPEYAVPSAYKFRSTFPLTSVGKIDYKKLELEENENLKNVEEQKRLIKKKD